MNIKGIYWLLTLPEYKQDTKAKTEDKDAFLGFIKGKVDASMLKFHGKGATSAFDLAGLRWAHESENGKLQIQLSV